MLNFISSNLDSILFSYNPRETQFGIGAGIYFFAFLCDSVLNFIRGDLDSILFCHNPRESQFGIGPGMYFFVILCNSVLNFIRIDLVLEFIFSRFYVFRRWILSVAIWTRYCFVITPVNPNLALVNFALFLTGAYQVTPYFI